jgi:hypothetical protein
VAKAVAQGQTANGTEAAGLLSGVAKPAWRGSASWHDQDDDTIWRADEVELVTAVPIQRGPLQDGLSLPSSWWSAFNESLDALAQQHTTRIATPDTEAMTQDLISREIERAFPGEVDTYLSSDAWVPAHADLNWSNLTAPEFWILDWEDHGLAPRGLDAANLWAASLTVPALADKVWLERQTDLTCRSGLLMGLFSVAKILNDSIPDALREQAEGHARKLVASLRG